MHILVVHQNAAPPTVNGLTRHFYLGRELVQRGHAVSIVVSDFDHRTRKKIQHCEREVHEGVEFIWCSQPGYSGNTAGRLWDMAVFAWHVLRLPETALDVVLGSSPPPFAAWAAQRLAHRCRRPFVLEIRDLWPETLLDIGGFNKEHPLIRVLAHLERHLYRTADRIITVLPNAAEYMAARGASRDKIAVIQNGANTTSTVRPAEPPPNRNHLVVMYAGAHGLANGLDTVLQAAALVRDWAPDRQIGFRFIGDGAEKPRLMRWAEHERLTNVTFEDPVPRAELDGVLAQADVFVANVRRASLYRYGISINKFFDYMAACRPIVVGIDAVNNPIEAAEAGISVPPDDSAAMASAIMQVAQMSASERFSMGCRGREYVKRHHNYETLAIALERTLSEVGGQEPLAKVHEAVASQVGRESPDRGAVRGP